MLSFWRHAGPKRWFVKSAAFDDEIRTRFLDAFEKARAGELSSWEKAAEGALALILLLDQFPRNMFRGDPRAYATDSAARAIADRALARGFDQNFGLPERRFFYLPYMHSESVQDQGRCVDLCRAAQDAEGVEYALLHADIIRRFGRFPHRNAVLGRATTPAEQAFLEAGGFAG